MQINKLNINLIAYHVMCVPFIHIVSFQNGSIMIDFMVDTLNGQGRSKLENSINENILKSAFKLPHRRKFTTNSTIIAQNINNYELFVKY